VDFYDFCPVCGGSKGIRVNGHNPSEAYLLCRDCDAHVKPEDVDHSELRVYPRRMLRRLHWLNGRFGGSVSRLQLARSMNVAKAPRFINILEGLVAAGLVHRMIKPSPKTGHDTLYYLAVSRSVATLRPTVAHSKTYAGW
jgi:hypothetical protein